MSYDRARQRRPLYAPPPPPGRQQSVLGFWVPLVVTSTIALGGLAAWIWSERSEHDDDDYSPGKPQRPGPGAGGSSYAQGGPQPSYSQGPPPSYPQGPPAQSQGVTGVGGMPAYGGPIPSQSAGPQGGPPPAPGGGEAASYYGSSAQQSRGQGQSDAHFEESQSQQTFFGQVRGAMRRTPSPQQFLDHASKQVSAGIAAAGSALGSIMEDPEHDRRVYDDRGQGEQSQRKRGDRREDRDREGFSDHERWSEEADEKVRVGKVEAESERRADTARSGREDPGKGRARKTVAVVVSADTNMDGKMDEEDIVYDQHASILSHLPEHHDPSTTDLFILIYAPGLPSPPPLSYRPNPQHLALDTQDTTSNLGSSGYSQVPTPAAATPSSELQSISPRIDPTTTPDSLPFTSPGQQFDALYTQALSLVSHPSQILCFTTPTSYTSLLRHLAPNLAYVSDLLAGEEGATIANLRGWVGSAVVVVGDDGTGGLAETETDEMETENEAEVGGGGVGRKRRERGEKWYERSGGIVGLGKGVEVVDVARVGDDWVKRVGGRE
ncbi:hypothetical protein B0A54_00869 [Friedmanniomyces endolithicus]|uniref:Uncharacterized protein n=1 Tax=Friedmanniomyces endolithicus TaxID=329885 RepID=A0A4U0VIA3_9PEZI|nr:hypothetical protein LTS09_002704 [Friedmanniomyces endolithicus]TKA48733.1 hypothetical protein B0A54_00869 [Friedmanniomyces endolithicus]